MRPHRLRYWSVASDGTKSRLRGSSVRTPLGGGCQVEVRLEKTGQFPFAVTVGVQGAASRAQRLPRLVVAPHAGNAAGAVIGDPRTRKIQHVPARRLLIEYGDIATIRVELGVNPTGQFVVNVQTEGTQAGAFGLPTVPLTLLIQPAGSNLIVFGFVEWGRLSQP